ncbi:MAG: NAD-dependent deacylase [Deltaproteobacteria bacterium]|nr:NAD-dependent deacylase [Deltaproteobacteria bacterium]
MNLFNLSDTTEVAKKILQRGEMVVLTGAGVSTESGIPDFRSPDGIWNKYDFTEFATIDALLRNPVKVFGFFKEFLGPLKSAAPNKAHKALARLEEVGLVKAVITQNIDNLHQKAGSKNVIELHGNALNARCMGCHKPYTLDDIENERYGFPPVCPDCKKLIKPDVVLFGERLPDAAIKTACQLSMDSKLMLVIGTSGTVAPASGLPHLAKKAGADIVEINVEPTIITKTTTDFFLQGKAGEIMSELCEKILNEISVG